MFFPRSDAPLSITRTGVRLRAGTTCKSEQTRDNKQNLNPKEPLLIAVSHPRRVAATTYAEWRFADTYIHKRTWGQADGLTVYIKTIRRASRLPSGLVFCPVTVPPRLHPRIPGIFFFSYFVDTSRAQNRQPSSSSTSSQLTYIQHARAPPSPHRAF